MTTEIKNKIQELRSLRDKATIGGSANYSKPISECYPIIEDAVLFTLKESARLFPDTPFYWIEDLNKNTVAYFGNGPTSKQNMDFHVEASNRWNDLLKCLEVAVSALEHVNEYWNRDANESATLNACEFAITKTDQALSEIKNILEK